MFIDFSITNFGPFKDRFTFSLESTSLDGNECNQLECREMNEPVLGFGIIFGPNASGKSYVLKALSALQSIVRNTMENNIIGTLYQPFHGSKTAPHEPTRFEIHLVKNDTKFDYSISFSNNGISEESLYFSPEGRRALVFSRKEQRFEFGRKSAKGMKSCSDTTSSCVTLLSTASKSGNEICSVVYDSIINDIIIAGYNDAFETIRTNKEIKSRLIKTLNIADFGISDIIFSTGTDCNAPAETDIPFENENNASGTHIFIEHDFKSSDNGRFILPLEYESTGTIQFICMMIPVIEALENGRLVVIDDLGTFLHPEVSEWILSQFKDYSNPNKAQMITCTQDLSLMSLDLLRRDQVWFTQKDDSTGASELYCLSDFTGVRNDIDLRKSYSIGKFNAKPFVSNGDIMN